MHTENMNASWYKYEEYEGFRQGPNHMIPFSQHQIFGASKRSYQTYQLIWEASPPTSIEGFPVVRKGPFADLKIGLRRKFHRHGSLSGALLRIAWGRCCKPHRWGGGRRGAGHQRQGFLVFTRDLEFVLPRPEIQTQGLRFRASESRSGFRISIFDP